MTTPPIAPRTKQDRDAGLRKVQRITCWTLAGALTGSGIFAGTAAQTASTTTASSAKGVASTNAAATTSAASTDDDTPPSTALQATPVQAGSTSNANTATIVSGAS